MTKKIKCEPQIVSQAEKVRVRVIRAPIVDTKELKTLIFSRGRALVL